jgi:hypothetical protein
MLIHTYIAFVHLNDHCAIYVYIYIYIYIYIYLYIYDLFLGHILHAKRVFIRCEFSILLNGKRNTMERNEAFLAQLRCLVTFFVYDSTKLFATFILKVYSCTGFVLNIAEED